MLLLALDTSTRQASIALCSEDELHGEYSWHVGNNHSVELLVHIQHLLAECRLTMQDIDGIAVAIGPGSFNGVRVALATAKALAFTLKKPLVGVSTLDSIAAQQRQWRGPICAVLEAGRSELYMACYVFDEIHSDDGKLLYHLQQLSDHQLLPVHEVSNYLQGQANAWVGVPGERQLPAFLFCGELSATSQQLLYSQMKENSLFVNNLQSVRHASILAMLALQRLHDGEKNDPLLLEPLYVRRPSITASVRKQPLLGGKPARPIGHNETEREEGALRH